MRNCHRISPQTTISLKWKYSQFFQTMQSNNRQLYENKISWRSCHIFFSVILTRGHSWRMTPLNRPFSFKCHALKLSCYTCPLYDILYEPPIISDHNKMSFRKYGKQPLLFSPPSSAAKMSQELESTTKHTTSVCCTERNSSSLSKQPIWDALLRGVTFYHLCWRRRFWEALILFSSNFHSYLKLYAKAFQPLLSVCLYNYLKAIPGTRLHVSLYS